MIGRINGEPRRVVGQDSEPFFVSGQTWTASIRLGGCDDLLQRQHGLIDDATCFLNFADWQD
jgi:hypothetical protein